MTSERSPLTDNLVFILEDGARDVYAWCQHQLNLICHEVAQRHEFRYVKEDKACAIDVVYSPKVIHFGVAIGGCDCCGPLHMFNTSIPTHYMYELFENTITHADIAASINIPNEFMDEFDNEDEED